MQFLGVLRRMKSHNHNQDKEEGEEAHGSKETGTRRFVTSVPVISLPFHLESLTGLTTTAMNPPLPSVSLTPPTLQTSLIKPQEYILIMQHLNFVNIIDLHTNFQINEYYPLLYAGVLSCRESSDRAPRDPAEPEATTP